MICNLCPRRCGALRTETVGNGWCRQPLSPVVARAGLHFWEEPTISGTCGSGTVFFTGCVLGCIFCQNGSISHENFGKAISVARLREIFQELIAQGVTAIVAQNDLMAMGVIDYCNQNGIEVGKDLALIGFDDREVASVTRPALSTVALPLFDIGCRATRIMLDMLAGEEIQENRKDLMECSIIERESSGGQHL